jgi:hypothetical protein
MEKNIDRDISEAETKSLRTQNSWLLKQNELLKREVQQVREMQANTQKELSVYKKMVFSSSTGGETQNEVLEMQHQRIFELETQLLVLEGKYSKIVNSSGSKEQTEVALRCREYERRLKDN